MGFKMWPLHFQVEFASERLWRRSQRGRAGDLCCEVIDIARLPPSLLFYSSEVLEIGACLLPNCLFNVKGLKAVAHLLFKLVLNLRGCRGGASGGALGICIVR
jgi:hypothetical protein